MLSEDFQTQVRELSNRDFLRLYLILQERFNQMKSADSTKLSKLIYAVKNPEKEKELYTKWRSRNKKS